MWDLNKYSKNRALIDDRGNEVSYGEMERIGKELALLIRKRCLVFCMCTNTIGSIVGYVSFLNYHIVPLLLNANMDREQLQKLIAIYHPAYIWMPDNDSIEDMFVGHRKIIRMAGYVLISLDAQDEYLLYDELGLLLITSGSTGSPKLVRVSYNNIEQNAKNMVGYLELGVTERPVTMLPMYHTYCLFIINSHLFVGATILVTELTVVHKQFWTFIQENRATSISGVPYTYEILEKLEFRKMNMPELRCMTQGGGKLSPELHKKYAEYALSNKKKFIVMYGLSEATDVISYLPAINAIEKCGSIGKVIPGGYFSLIDVEGKEIKEDETVGEIVYEGVDVALGYAECGKDLCKGDEWRGRLETGDLARRDKDGFYYIEGRKSRFVKVYGHKVNLDEVERMLKTEYKELECACSGIDDNIYVYMTENEYMEQIPKLLSQKTKLNRRAFNVVVIDKIPRTDSGKVRYDELL